MLAQALVGMLSMYTLSIIALFGSVLYLVFALRKGLEAYSAAASDRKKVLRPVGSVSVVKFAPVAMKKVMGLALLAVFLAISFAPAQITAAAPVPVVEYASYGTVGDDLVITNVDPVFQTEEPVTIDIPVSQIFSSVNTWIETLIPVYAIPAGIAIAVAILGLIVTLIVVAFGRKGGR